jgi:hypothetical protein
MTSLRTLLIVASFASLAGCASQPQTAQEVSQQRMTSEREVVMMETRKSMWDTNRDSPDYARNRAINGHRLFCMDHPSDDSCAGWNWYGSTATVQVSEQ